MSDPFVGDSVITSARSAFAITKSNTTNFLTGEGLEVPKAIYVGTGGDLAVQLVDDAGTVTFKNVAGGSVLPIRVQRVLETGTSAADIVGLV